MTHPPRDPRLRRQHTAGMLGAEPTRDALAAAVRLDLSMQAMREQQLQHGPVVEQLVDAAIDHGIVDAGTLAAVQLAPTSITAAEFAAAVAGADEPAPDPTPAVVPVTPPPPPVSAPPAPFSSERSLTWRSRHDERSLAYGIRSRISLSLPMADVMLPVGPVLDQGAEGECVGCGVVDAVNAMRPAPVLDLAEAATLYHAAQRLDDVPGEDYTGTSVLAGMQAAVAAGYLGGYLWAFGTRDVAQTILRRRPVVIGIPWLSGMYDTGPGGLVQLRGDDRGEGHCLAVVGLRLKGPQGQPGPFFVWQNSWGAGYGDGGLGYVHHRDLAQLLHGVGEAAIPTAEAQT